MEQYARDFCAFRHTLSVWVLIAASLTFTRRTDGYSLLGICMGACLRLNTRLRITCRPGGPSSGWIVTLTGRSGGLGFFRMSPSPRSSLPLCGAFAIMANHVHVLLLPRVPPSRLLKSLKGYTAYQANRVLGRTGEPFWQRESYDHWVRSQEEWQRIAAYIENNPVKAGVVSQAEEYRWASAHATWRAKLDPPSVGTSADVARKSACATDAVRDP